MLLTGRLYRLVFIILMAAPAFPQAGNGSVRGTVRDQADAVIPNAKVKLTHTATSVVAESVTNEAGFYVFPVVMPGAYELEVEAKGLARFHATLQVQVQQSATVDPQLRIATEVTMVNVQDATPLVSVDSTSLGTVLERRRIEQLPINGRSIGNLLLLTPGMEESSRAFGMRRGAHEFFFDGASLFDALDGAGTVTRPPGLDTIEEFKVENNSSSAKYSRITSVIITSRSGACFPGYLWWNGYIPANQINSVNAQGKPNGIMGIPADFKSAVAPLIPWGTTTPPANFPPSASLPAFWDTNTSWIRLDNGNVQQVDYNDNLNPTRNQFLPGVWEWGNDASLFKEISIRESVRLRLNVDMFNVFNAPGIPISVGSNGLVSTRESGHGSREMQITLRLSW